MIKLGPIRCLAHVIVIFTMGSATFSASLLPIQSAAQDVLNSESRNAMKVTLTVDGKAYSATLDNNPTAKHFYRLLPLELTLSDFNSTEKVGDLPERLTTENAPEGFTPKKGDLTFYAPWGNLAIFYKDFRYSKNLIRLGRLNTGIDDFDRAENFSIRIEAYNEF